MSEGLFDDLISTIANENLHISKRQRPTEVYACVDWLLPTAAFLYISKTYFDGFLQEMGKEHYALLKKGLISLWGKMLGPTAPVLTILGSKEKISARQSYSGVYSIFAEAADGYKLKLLFPSDISKDDYSKTVSAFLDFLLKFYGNELDQQILDDFDEYQPLGLTIPLVYDKAAMRIRPLCVIPGRPK